MRTVTARAFRDPTIHWQASVLESFQIFLWATGPRIFLALPTRLVAKMEANLILLFEFALQIDIGLGLWQFLLLLKASS